MRAEFYIFKEEAGEGVQFKTQCGLECAGKQPWVWSRQRKGNSLGFLLPVGPKVFVCFLNIYLWNKSSLWISENQVFSLSLYTARRSHKSKCLPTKENTDCPKLGALSPWLFTPFPVDFSCLCPESSHLMPHTALGRSRRKGPFPSQVCIITWGIPVLPKCSYLTPQPLTYEYAY